MSGSPHRTRGFEKIESDQVQAQIRDVIEKKKAIAERMQEIRRKASKRC
jgi:hypothetical protein